MFRHRGRSRRMIHNLKLASLLSFVAGIVNVTGFFAVQVLTTNVTGHFAYFAEGMARKNFTSAWYFLAYVLAFLAGAFISNFTVEVTERVAKRYVNAAPVFAEIALLLIVILVGARGVQQDQHLIALLLLFAMGLQNAMVTRISNAVVRTTHLTGLFTDLGIELSQLFFYRKEEQQRKLTASVKLRFAVIGFFFLGCIIGGMGYMKYHIEILYLAIFVLFIGIIYSNVRYRYLLLRKSIGDH